jgi:hypothetical protein
MFSLGRCLRHSQRHRIWSHGGWRNCGAFRVRLGFRCWRLAELLGGMLRVAWRWGRRGWRGLRCFGISLAVRCQSVGKVVADRSLWSRLVVGDAYRVGDLPYSQAEPPAPPRV